jgi:dolichyl-phosphate-mannose--protein O-mannosyl transferase
VRPALAPELALTRRQTLLTCLFLYVFAQVVFLVNVSAADRFAGDEKYYVPAARQWVAMQDTTNPEHPPLGKELMAIGIALCGDRPLGWRFMSTVFGSLTLVGMYLWGLALFRSQRTALLAALITLGNQFLYVQSRVGMLDVFMFAFEVFGLAAVCRAWDPDLPRQRVRRLLLLAGAAFGLATACKWTGAFAWATAAAAVIGARVMGRRGIAAQGGESDGWYDPRLFSSVSGDDLLSAFLIIPAGLYLATFLPYLFVAHQPRYGLLDLLAMQKQIWQLQQRVVDGTRYVTPWTTWPFMTRPMWYYFEWEPGRTAVRCILCLGNPLVIWGGLAALAACVWSWAKRRTRAPFWIALTWAALYLGHAVLQRKVGYIFYYYPAAMTLSLAWAFVLDRGAPQPGWRGQWARWRGVVFLLATYLVAAYFFDLLCAVKESPELFRSRMWFRSWY